MTTAQNNPSTAQEASRVIKSGPGTLFSLTVVNNSAGDLYAQLFDAVSAPADGAIPVDVAFVKAGGIGGVDYGDRGKDFTTGIVAVLSSAPGSKLIASAVGLFFPRFL